MVHESISQAEALTTIVTDGRIQFDGESDSRAILRPRLSESLTEAIARQIIGGRLNPGDPLPSEATLAQQYGVSKVVIRECVMTLAALDLVRVKQGKRTVVLEESEWNVVSPMVQKVFHLEGKKAALTAQIYDIRIILEVQAAAWTAERGTPQEFKRLRSLVNDMWRIAETSCNLKTFLEVDRAFHDTIARSARNIVLRAVMKDLHPLLLTGWTDSKIRAEELTDLAGQHDAIAIAIGLRDPVAAMKAMKEHLEHARALETERVGLEATVD